MGPDVRARAGCTGRLLGGRVAAPSTLGTFLRAFTFGHVRQLDALLGRSVERAWQAGAGPGDARLVVDVDSFVGEVCGRLKRGASYGYTKLLGYHPILATRADTREVLHIRMRKGSANTQKGCASARNSPPRVDRSGSRGEKLLRADSGSSNTKVFAYLEKIGWQYWIGGWNIKKVQVAVQAIDETAWQHIDYPVGGEAQSPRRSSQALAHFPSGDYDANAAWTVLAALAHNLLRWTQSARPARHDRSRGPHPAPPTPRSSRPPDPSRRGWTLHLPARWPRHEDDTRALDGIRARPTLA